MNKTLNHPVFGPLQRTCTQATNCDWKGKIHLPSFVDCYERWNSDCSETEHDPSHEEQRRGIFPLLICSGRFGWELPEEYYEPFDTHIAAYRILTKQHEALAESLAEQLALFIYNCGIDQFLSIDDPECFERLQERDRILGTLSLDSVCLFTRSRDGVAYAGFSFNSLWDHEHGLGSVALGTQFLGIGSMDYADESTFGSYLNSQ